MPLDICRLKRIFEQLQADRSNAESEWDQIEKFCCPGVGGRSTGSSGREGEVDWRRDEVWDFTAVVGLLKLAASIHGAVTSSVVRWLQLVPSDKRLLKDQEVLQFLELLGDMIYEMLQDSDFNAEISRLYHELVAFGNAVISCEARKEAGKFVGLDFTTIPIREAFFTLDTRGRVEHFFRRIQWTPNQMRERFKDDLPAKIEELLDTPEAVTRKFEVLFAIYPRAEVPSTEYECEVAAEARPWGACYFLNEGGDEPEEVLLGYEDGYYEHPVFRAIWQAQAGSDLGRGLGIVLLPTVKLINSICEAKINALEKVVDPSFVTTERGLLANPDTAPGGITVVRALDQFKVMESGTRFDVVDREVADLRAMVRRVCHEDELTLKDSPSMTATEAQIRYELMNRVLGSTLSLLQSDVLDLIVMLCIQMLARERRLPPVPPKLKLADGKFGIEYHGPLARAQRTDEVAAIERLASFVAALAKLEFQDARDVFDPVSAVREVAARLGCPAGVLISEDKVRAKIAQREAAATQLAKAQVAKAQGEALEQAGMGAQAMQEAGAPVPAQPPPVVNPPFPG